ncbi:MAG TPA: hypothetical protein VHA11_04260 [Bryobacteraceae bacterium]|nr:hypothetical protein [Bryobacteraceae bacterium]
MGTNGAPAVIAAILMAVPFSAQAGAVGRIYVYAQRPTPARSWLPIFCGGAVVAEMKRGTVVAINVPPGRHTLSTQTGVPVSVEVRSGEESFVRLDWHFEEGHAPIPVLSVVSSERARREMKYLSYIDATRVLSASVPKTDPREPASLRLHTRDEH